MGGETFQAPTMAGDIGSSKYISGSVHMLPAWGRRSRLGIQYPLFQYEKKGVLGSRDLEFFLKSGKNVALLL